MRYIFPTGLSATYAESISALKRVMGKGRGTYVRPGEEAAFAVLQRLIEKGAVKEQLD